MEMWFLTWKKNLHLKNVFFSFSLTKTFFFPGKIFHIWNFAAGSFFFIFLKSKQNILGETKDLGFFSFFLWIFFYFRKKHVSCFLWNQVKKRFSGDKNFWKKKKIILEKLIFVKQSDKIKKNEKNKIKINFPWFFFFVIEFISHQM